MLLASKGMDFFLSNVKSYDKSASSSGARLKKQLDVSILQEKLAVSGLHRKLFIYYFYFF